MSDQTTQSASARDDGAFSIDIRVYYEDTDAAGVVYYANYLRFMERARSDWLRALDISMDVTSQNVATAMEEGSSPADVANSGHAARRERALEHSLVTASEPVGDKFERDVRATATSPIFVVRRAEIDYGMPARLNDQLRVDVRLDEESLERRLRGAAFWLRQSVTRLGGRGHGSENGPDQVLVRGRIQVACIDPHSFRPRRLPASVVERVLESCA